MTTRWLMLLLATAAFGAGCEARLTGSVPPVARAGTDQWVRVGETAQLDGSQSSPADGQPTTDLTYQWLVIAKPTGSAAELSDPGAATPTFVVDVPGQFIFELVVAAGAARSRPDVAVVYGYRPLEITSQSPPNHALNVNPAAPVVLVFSEPVQPESVRPDTFMVLHGQDLWPGQVSTGDGNLVASFTPSTPYPASALMAVVVSQRVVSLSGQTLPMAYHGQFMTASGPDVTAPMIISLTPADGSRDVIASTSIVALVSEPVSTSSATGDIDADGCPDALHVVAQSGGCVAGQVLLSGAGTRLILTPDQPLLAGETYTTTVAAGTLQDLAGNVSTDDVTASFTVMSGADLTPPTVVSLYPGDSYVDVPLGARISTTFSEAIDPASVSTASFTVQPARPAGDR